MTFPAFVVPVVVSACAVSLPFVLVGSLRFIVSTIEKNIHHSREAQRREKWKNEVISGWRR